MLVEALPSVLTVSSFGGLGLSTFFLIFLNHSNSCGGLFCTVSANGLMSPEREIWSTSMTMTAILGLVVTAFCTHSPVFKSTGSFAKTFILLSCLIVSISLIALTNVNLNHVVAHNTFAACAFGIGSMFQLTYHYHRLKNSCCGIDIRTVLSILFGGCAIVYGILFFKAESRIVRNIAVLCEWISTLSGLAFYPLMGEEISNLRIKIESVDLKSSQRLALASCIEQQLPVTPRSSEKVDLEKPPFLIEISDNDS